MVKRGVVEVIKNGRQVSDTLKGIREDHKNRYSLACTFGYPNSIKTSLDIGSGIGYGSYMMACEGLKVTSYEIDYESYHYGIEHYSHPNLTRVNKNIFDVDFMKADLATAFELIEHINKPDELLAELSTKVKWLICSVPNELVIPFSENRHHEHKRHYTPDEFTQLICDSGWSIFMMGGQKGKRGKQAEVQFDINGDYRTLVAICKSNKRRE